MTLLGVCDQPPGWARDAKGPRVRPGAPLQEYWNYLARASQQVLVIRRVTTYGSMLALGLRSSM